MKKLMPGLAILVFFSNICYGQLLGKSGLYRLPYVKDDTLYLDVQNVLALTTSASELVDVKAANAYLAIRKDSLVVVPTLSGMLKITFVYIDKIEKKIYFCRPLSYPGRGS